MGELLFYQESESNYFELLSMTTQRFHGQHSIPYVYNYRYNTHVQIHHAVTLRWQCVFCRTGIPLRRSCPLGAYMERRIGETREMVAVNADPIGKKRTTARDTFIDV